MQPDKQHPRIQVTLQEFPRWSFFANSSFKKRPFEKKIGGLRDDEHFLQAKLNVGKKEIISITLAFNYRAGTRTECNVNGIM